MLTTLPATAVEPENEHLQRFVRRVYRMHTLAVTSGAVMVGTVFHIVGAPVTAWVVMLVYAGLWPHAAYQLARHNADAIGAVRFNLMVDAVMVGVWIVLMDVNVFASATLAMVQATELIAIGGLPLLARGFALSGLACAVTALAAGVTLRPGSNLPETFASLPMMMTFPVAMSMVMHRLRHQVRHQYRLLAKLSSMDGLSGLLNRAAWEHAVNAVVAARSQGAVMLLVDIDHFKQVNDQFGHTAGDDVVRQVGAAIRECVRGTDVAGRYGGDEFGVVLCGADAGVAVCIAERIRASVAGSTFPRAPGLRCTLSIGIADARSSPRSAAEWIARADEALYRAKAYGRNAYALAG